MTEVYMTTKGGRDVTAAVADSDAHLGVEATNDVPGSYGVEFVDFPFTDPNATVDDHVRRVRAECPRLTVAPDVENDRTLGDAVAVGDELGEYADTVIVVPKDCHPAEVPDRFRPAVATTAFGSGTPWPLWAYGRPVHILGGSPARQLTIGRHLPVASVDTSWFVTRCRFGMWDGKSIDQTPDNWDFRRRLRESLDNYAAAWAEVASDD